MLTVTVPKAPPALRIYRDVPFDPAKHYGRGWTLWHGPRDGSGLAGDVECDERLHLLGSLDGSRIAFENFMYGQKAPLDGEEKLERVRASGLLPLDPKGVETLVNEPMQNTLRWLYAARGIAQFEVAAPVLRRPDGKRFLSTARRLESGLWRLECDFVGGGRHNQNLTPVYV